MSRIYIKECINEQEKSQIIRSKSTLKKDNEINSLGKINLYDCHGNQHGDFPETTNKLAYDPDIPFLDFYPKDLKSI